jgi:branched-chain amino acid transport system permease protein
MSLLYHQFAAFTISGLAFGAIYALMAFGYTIVYRILGLFNFAHGGTYMVATFVGLWVVKRFDTSGNLGPFTVLGIAVAMCAAAAVAGTIISVGLEMAVFRPIRIRRGGGLAGLVAGLGMLNVLQEIIGLTEGRDPLGVPQPLGTARPFTVFGGAVSVRDLVVFFSGLIAMLALQRFVNVTRSGRALRCAGQDPGTASLMGINVSRVIILCFVLAGASAGLAATLSDLYFGNTSFDAGFSLGIMGFTAALLGGMGSVPGALVGGIILGLAESYGGAVFGAQWQDVIAFCVLILILIARPRGLIGERMATVRA